MNEHSAKRDLPAAAAFEGGELRDFLAAQALTPLAPYELVDSVRRPDAERYRATVERNIAGRWSLEGATLTGIRAPVDWNFGSQSNRIHLQCWTPVTCLLAAHRLGGGEHFRALAVEYALDWLKTFHLGYKDKTIAELVAGAKSPSNLAWYDMAAGTRAYRLAYVADLLCRNPDVDPELKRALLESLVIHARILAEHAYLAGHSNHGLYQSLGLLLLCRRFAWWPPIGAFLGPAREAFNRTIRSQFTEAGVHREHSPGYHMSVLTTLAGAREAGVLPEGGEEHQIVNRAEEALAWMIMPGRRLAPFGDTDWTVLAGLGPDDLYRDGPLRFLLSGGAEGEMPPSGVRHMSDFGYAFARLHSRAPDEASYLAQMTAFHSRVHKHADHGTFVWAEGDLAILTDPGRYGYEGRTHPGSDLHRAGFWYDDPKRIYVETTRAHNCVEIDGRDHGRVDVLHLGSGLNAAGMAGGLAVFQSSIMHGASVAQRRALILNPRRWLIVADLLEDEGSAPHDFGQWFKLAPGWTAAPASESCIAASTLARALWVEDLLGSQASAPAYGAAEPLGGWASTRGGELTPAQSLCFERTGVPGACFATIFALDGAIEPHPGCMYDAEGARLMLAFADSAEEIAIEVSGFDVWSADPARVAAKFAPR